MQDSHNEWELNKSVIKYKKTDTASQIKDFAHCIIQFTFL